jgi:hypothetical protein
VVGGRHHGRCGELLQLARDVVIDVERPVTTRTVSVARVRRARSGRALSVIVAIASLVLALFAATRSPEPAIALFLLVATITAATIRPILGLYAIVFFTLVGDSVTMPWYPFTKNLSSAESLLYLSNKLTLSPLEVLVGATFTIWIIGVVFDPRSRFIGGQLLAAVSVFTAFVAFGFVRGVGSGGDLRIALFEGRAIFLILPVYLLTINLCDRGELRRLLWTAVAAIVVNVFFALKFLDGLSPVEREVQEDLGEHSASIHVNMLILLTLTLMLYRAGSRLSRTALLMLTIPALVAYFAAERRSAVVALAIGVILIVFSLWWRERAKFYVIAPILIITAAGYTAAFWNSTSSVGFPAQALKAVLQPDSVSEKDRSSDLYRDLENFDVNFTIRSSPALGLGFGQKFLRPAPLPDISFFEFYEYIPHNSFMWIWIKTGFLGFASMLVMYAIAVRDGARSVVAARSPTIAAMAIIGVVNVVMFAVFSFVDIAWDSRSMIVLALSFSLCSLHLMRPESVRVRQGPIERQ